MGDCSSAEEKQRPYGGTPAEHATGAYPQPYAATQYQAPPGSYGPGQPQPYGGSQMPPQHSGYGGPPPSGHYPAQQPAYQQPPPQMPPPQQHYYPQPSALPRGDAAAYGYASPGTGAPPPSGQVPLQPYSSQRSMRDRPSARASGYPPTGTAGAHLPPEQQKRVRALCEIFKTVDPDVVAAVVSECPHDEDRQVESLSQMHKDATQLKESSRRASGTASRGGRSSSVRHLFSKQEAVDACFQGDWFPATVTEVHDPVEPGAPVRYTVQWREDNSITLVNEGEVRPRRI
eukprot:TRINITY_DN8548_c0_g1_i1.p1 TRINITY_DN8548_c0_g1~~TRINITY_DN8548_c0_g1_i1.p1  ORF type:complete len:331 (+),score=62.67 TRINITY_DN8548_c0_g1_i1:130-993(+)